MRTVLSLLAFMALAFAPLAVPAQAMVPAPQAHCADMPGMDHLPSAPQMSDDAKCCVALPVALPPASASLDSEPLPIAAPTRPTEDQLAAIEHEAEDPPPRA